MKTLFKFSLFSLIVMPLLAFADDSGIIPPTTADLAAFVTALGGVKSLETLGVVGLVVQGLLLAMKSTVGSVAGKFQLIIVMALSMIGGIIGLKMQGLDMASVLVHSTTLAAMQVFVHQLYKQFIEKK